MRTLLDIMRDMEATQKDREVPTWLQGRIAHWLEHLQRMTGIDLYEQKRK